MKNAASRALAACLLLGLLELGLYAQESIVGHLRASVSGCSVELSWQAAAAPTKGYAIYRSSLPFDSDSYAKAEIIGSVGAMEPAFVDSPPAGTPWFYLVLPLDADGRPVVVFQAGENMTAAGISIEGANEGAASLAVSASWPVRAENSVPLPCFLYGMKEGVPGGATALGPEEGKAMAALLTERGPASEPMPPRTGPSQTIAPRVPALPPIKDRPSDPGFEAALARANSKAAAGNWEGARQDLEAILDKAPEPENAARAHYYAGVALSYLGNPKAGLFEFLVAQDFYPAESAPWISYLLRVLSRK